MAKRSSARQFGQSERTPHGESLGKGREIPGYVDWGKPEVKDIGHTFFTEEEEAREEERTRTTLEKEYGPLPTASLEDVDSPDLVNPAYTPQDNPNPRIFDDTIIHKGTDRGLLDAPGATIRGLWYKAMSPAINIFGKHLGGGAWRKRIAAATEKQLSRQKNITEANIPLVTGDLFIESDGNAIEITGIKRDENGKITDIDWAYTNRPLVEEPNLDMEIRKLITLKKIQQEQGRSNAEIADIVKEHRNTNIEQRPGYAAPLGSKWYGMPVAIVAATAPWRGFWHKLFYPNVITEKNLFAGTNKEVAENVEWQKTKARNPELAKSMEQVARLGAEDYHKAHAKGLKAVEEVNEAIAKKEDKDTQWAQSELDRIKFNQTEDGYEVIYNQQKIDLISNELVSHAINKLSDTASTEEEQELLDTIAPTLAYRVMDKIYAGKRVSEKTLLVQEGVEKMFVDLLEQWNSQTEDNERKAKEDYETLEASLGKSPIDSIDIEFDPNSHKNFIYINGIRANIGYFSEGFISNDPSDIGLLDNQNQRRLYRDYFTNEIIHDINKTYPTVRDQNYTHIRDKVQRAVEKFIKRELNNIVRPTVIETIPDIEEKAEIFFKTSSKDSAGYQQAYQDFIQTLNKFTPTRAELERIGVNDPNSPVHMAIELYNLRKSA